MDNANAGEERIVFTNDQRFSVYCIAHPVSSHETAKELLEDIKNQHPKANHHCFAWRLADGEERMSDDGEPRGSAGAPILKRLISKN